MDIVAFTKTIHCLEENYDFFHHKDNNGLFYWDIVRHDVFYAIYYELANIQALSLPPVGRYDKVKSIFKNLFYSLRLNLKLKPTKYLFFVSSRYKNAKHENVDYAIADILALTPTQDRLIIDNVIRFGEKYQYKSFFNSGMMVAGYRQKFKKEATHVSYQVARILVDHFSLKVSLDQLILNLVEKYNLEYRYYSNFLKKVRPEKIFLVQNGIQKALFTVANELNIPLFEVQHGLVSFIHPAYDYPKTISYEHLHSFPKYFLTFSAFWAKNINYPVKEKIILGNDFFASKLPKIEKRYDLTFVTANIYSTEINALIYGFVSQGFMGNIALKLHPNQYGEIENTKNQFAKFPNVTVIYNEATIKEVLQLSLNIVAVQSTCVYEALDNGVKVFIYRIKDYRTHEDIFANPNVYQFDDWIEIPPLMQKNYLVLNQIEFFEQFNRRRCIELIKTN